MQILLDGHNIKDLELHWLRSNIGLVGQEPLLFSCSIRENICYGCPEASEEQILSAAADANALNFIRQLPEGLETQVWTAARQIQDPRLLDLVIQQIENHAILLPKIIHSFIHSPSVRRRPVVLWQITEHACLRCQLGSLARGPFARWPGVQTGLFAKLHAGKA